MPSRPPSRASERGAFTLVELLVSLAILASVLAAVVRTASTASRSFKAGSESVEMRSHAERTLARIGTMLMGAAPGTLQPASAPPLSASQETWQRADGQANGLVTWSTPESLTLGYDTAETNNGLDDDGDGRIDEGQILWTRDPGNPDSVTAVLCTGVAEYLEGESPNGLDDNGNGLIDERGFCVSGSAGLYSIRLTLERRPAGADVQRATAEASVRLRNP